MRQNANPPILGWYVCRSTVALALFCHLSVFAQDVQIHIHDDYTPAPRKVSAKITGANGTITYTEMADYGSYWSKNVTASGGVPLTIQIVLSDSIPGGIPTGNVVFCGSGTFDNRPPTIQYSHDYYNCDVGFGPPPNVDYKLSRLICNDTTGVQRVTAPGFGTTTLQPGDCVQWDFTVNTNAMPGAIQITQEDYLGDSQWGTNTLAALTDWKTAGNYVTNTISVVPDVPFDKFATNLHTTYGAPTTNMLDAGTYKTGVETVRTAQLEQSKDIIEAIDRAAADARYNAGMSNPPSIFSVTNAITARVASAKSQIGTAFAATNTLIDAFGTIPTVGSIDPSFYQIHLGNSAEYIDWNPTFNGHFANVWQLGKALAQWAIWISYALYCLYSGFSKIQVAVNTEQVKTTTSVPVFQNIFAVALGVFFIGALAVLCAWTVNVVTYQILGSEMATGALDWQNWTGAITTARETTSVSISQIFAIGEVWVPIRAVFQMPVATLMFEFLMWAMALTYAATVKALAGI